MNTKEIAEQLVALCRKGEFEAAQNQLFSADAVSIEPEATPDFSKETKGLKAILEKGHTFASMVQEIHSVVLSEPLVAGDSFACTMELDVTMKGRGRVHLAEVCVYETENGKIVSESFHM